MMYVQSYTVERMISHSSAQWEFLSPHLKSLCETCNYKRSVTLQSFMETPHRLRKFCIFYAIKTWRFLLKVVYVFICLHKNRHFFNKHSWYDLVSTFKSLLFHCVEKHSLIACFFISSHCYRAVLQHPILLQAQWILWVVMIIILRVKDKQMAAEHQQSVTFSLQLLVQVL